MLSDTETAGAFAIVSSKNLSAAISLLERLGFSRDGGSVDIVEQAQAGEGPWHVPKAHNPFGVFISTPEVEAIAARVEDLIIRPGGILRHREWGMYEVGIAGPDGLLVRIGWPLSLFKAG